MGNTVGENICLRLQKLQAERSLWDTHIQECYDFCDPVNSQIISQKPRGGKRNDDLYDSTAAEALRTFVSGMYSGNTRPDTRWFEYFPKSLELREDEEATRWYSDVTRIVYQHLADSNFNLEIQGVYKSLGVAGRSCIFALGDELTPLRFKSVHYAESWISEDENGLVDTVYRKFPYTARQAIQMWGEENVSRKVREAAQDIKKMDNEFDFIHAIFPRENSNLQILDSREFPYASVVVEEGEKNVVDETGFHEQPFACPRFWKDDKEVEGRSPAMETLASVKMLNAIALTMLKKGNFDADPPWLVPDDDSLLSINTAPGSKIYYSPNVAGAKPEIMQSGSKFEVAEFTISRYEKSVNKSFFVDLFATLQNLDDTKERTAFEINQRLQESAALITPPQSRLKTELFDPIMGRVVRILERQNLLPPMPLVVAEQPEFDIEYRGALSILAKSLDLKSIQNFASFISPFVEIKPDLIDSIKFDDIVRLSGTTLGVPSEVLRTEEELQELRQARAEAQSTQQLIENATEAAKAVPGLQQPTQEGSPLQALTQGA